METNVTPSSGSPRQASTRGFKNVYNIGDSSSVDVSAAAPALCTSSAAGERFAAGAGCVDVSAAAMRAPSVITRGVAGAGIVDVRAAESTADLRDLGLTAPVCWSA